MGWRTKSIAQVQSEFDRGELKRTLGPIHLILFGIGCIIGAGIFVRTGTAAALYAGPAVMLSFVIAGVVCAFAGLCYAELASMLPVSGSAYTYAYTTVGEFGAWIMGALLLLEYALAASVVAVGWSGYAVSLLNDIGLFIPAELTQAVGKLVVDKASTFSMTDPLVSLNGVTATLTDGSVVQFLSQGKATISGAFSTALAQYDVVDQAKAGGYVLINSLDIAVNANSQAVLTEATKVMDPATAHLRDLAVGTQLSVPAGSIVQLPLATVVPVDPSSIVTSLFNLPAVFITLSVTMLLVLGVSESALVNNIIVAIKVTVILAFIAVGAFFVNPDNWHPFIPEPTGVENQFGMDGVIRAATIVFFAYIGFEAVSTAGQEAKDPRKDMPIGILGSLIICTVLYMLTAAVLTGVVSFTKLNVAAPVATAVDTFGPEWGWLAKLIKIGAIAGLSSVVLVLMFGQTRVFYAMSRDGLLPKTLARVHPKFKTPWINTLIVGVLVSLAAAVYDINKLGDLTSVGTLVAFGLVCFSVIWLRFKRPDLPRHFKVWGYPVIPAIGVILCFVLAWIGVEHAIRVWFAGFLVVTVAAYFLYPFWVSPMRNKAPDATTPAS
ncbi:MAG TPA: amino acid permease [Steroidobacteraceae bacterium]